MKIKEALQTLNRKLPIIVTITDDDNQSSLRSCKDIDELADYIKYRPAAESEIVLMKEVNHTVYIDAMTDHAYIKWQVRERDRVREKEKRNSQKRNGNDQGVGARGYEGQTRRETTGNHREERKALKA